MKPRALLYARVSTADKGQDYAAQLEELRRVAQQRGWQVVGELHDTTSGTDAKRPGLGAALEQCRAGGVDIFAATATDRLARSTRNLIDLVDELDALGVKLACVREGAVDATTPQGRAFMQVRAVFAELERNLIAERIREGLAVRRARGVKLGRPRKVSAETVAMAASMRSLNPRPTMSWADICRTLKAEGRGSHSIGAVSRAVGRYFAKPTYQARA